MTTEYIGGITGYCLFSQSACNTCPSGYVSTTSCACNAGTGTLKSKYTFSDMNTNSSFLVFDRNEAYDLVSGNSGQFDLIKINHNIPPPTNLRDFFNNECWPSTSSGIVMVKAWFCCKYDTNQASAYGFFNYTINGTTIRLTRRTRTESGLCPGDQCYLATVDDGYDRVIDLNNLTISADKSRITWHNNVYI